MHASTITGSLLGATFALALTAAGNANAISDTDLAGTVAQRLSGDRSGACMAVAVIAADVSRARVCADPNQVTRIGPDSAFEIGSISKTMTGTLLAELINAGKASLDDPLADWLPEGTKVPGFDGQPILLRHIVTHTSGLPALPPGVPLTDPNDPYAALTAQQLIDALAAVKLDEPPGTSFSYSNFALMLLSHAITQRTGVDLETLLDERLFTPLQMDGAYIAKRPDGVRVATGHRPGGQSVPPWNFPVDLAGVGGVHATLDDMVRYVQAQLQPGDSALGKAIRLTHSQPDAANMPGQAITWFIAPLNGSPVYMHEGGTGGFSSLVAFDPEKQRGVVILADTAMTSLGGLGNMAKHLLDDQIPLDTPHTVARPDKKLLAALTGTWQLEGGPQVELSQRRGKLYIHPAGQPVFELGHDSAGDFYPLDFDARLQPLRQSDGSYRFTWHQGGGAMPATRVEPASSKPAPAVTMDAAQLQEYVGTYPLMPGFDLSVTVKKGQLQARATGQGAFPLDSVGDDSFEAPAFGIRINFQRGVDGKVRSLELLQGGGVMKGERQ